MKSLWITTAVALLALTAVPQAFAYSHMMRHRMMHHRMMHRMMHHRMMMHHM